MAHISQAVRGTWRHVVLPMVVSLRRGGLVAALALVLTGLLFAWQATRLDLGSIALPGPGFFPLALGILLAAGGGVIALAHLRGPVGNATVELGHRDVLIGFLALLVVAPAFERLGTYATLGVLAFVLLVGIGRVAIARAAIASAAGMVAVWGFFKLLLGLQLPTGPF